MSVWGTVGSVALAILILLVMITIHEFGHYLAGKILRFRIDEFSVGFGPALVKLEWQKTGEVFAVRLIPLGGYCAFHGEDGLEEEAPPTLPSPLGEGGGDPESPPAPLGHPDTPLGHPERSEGSQGTQSEVPGHPDPERSEGEGSQGLTEPPWDSSASPQNDQESPPQTPSAPKKRDWNDDGAFTHMKPWKRIIVLIAGATMNYLLALLLIIIGFSAYGQDLVQIDAVREDEAWAAEFSFREGDILLGAAGKDFYLANDIARAVNNKKTGDRVEFLVSRVQADGSRREEKVSIALREEVHIKNSTDFGNVWKALGADDDGKVYLVSTTYYRFGFFETLGRSFVYSFRLAGSIFHVLGELLTGKLGLEAFGGPVTTITMTSQIASRGMRDFLEISALIGVNLAVFNLLPIPALDGSKVVSTAIEWVRGRPISRKIEAIIHAVGFILLIGFAILVDVLQFL